MSPTRRLRGRARRTCQWRVQRAAQAGMRMDGRTSKRDSGAKSLDLTFVLLVFDFSISLRRTSLLQAGSIVNLLGLSAAGRAARPALGVPVAFT